MRKRALPESCAPRSPGSSPSELVGADAKGMLASVHRGELVVIDDWRCHGHDTMGRHLEWCADDRIVVTRRGAWELQVDGEGAIADPLTAVLWNRHTEYRVRHPVPGGDQCTVFRLTERGTHELGGGRRTFGRLGTRLEGAAYLEHRRLLLRSAHSSLDSLAIEEAALEFVRGLASRGPLSPRSRATHRAVRRARDYIAANFRCPLSVSAIAHAASCSPFHLSRLFRRETGFTLHAAVTTWRLREALERLVAEPERISTIATDVGFSSHSHLGDSFRREFGCAPRSLKHLASLARSGEVKSKRR